MPKHFKTNKRLLTLEEKYSRAIFYYTYDDPSFEVVYEDDDNMFDAYGQPKLNIDANMSKLSSNIKELVLEFGKREIYDETISLKCLNCDAEFEEDFETIEEVWDERFQKYPTLCCPNCNKEKLVPIDIYNKYKR